MKLAIGSPDAELREARDLIVQLQRELERARQVISEHQLEMRRWCSERRLPAEDRMNDQMLDSAWLALPLSARGLLRELAAISTNDGALDTSVAGDADIRAIGNEVASDYSE